MRATWQVDRAGAAEILRGIIVRRTITFAAELTCQFILGRRPMHRPSVLAACELRFDRRAKYPASRLSMPFVLSIAVLVLVLVIDLCSILAQRFRDTIKFHCHPSQHRDNTHQPGFEFERR